MLRFTPDQQAAINAARAGFNQTQLALAANSADMKAAKAAAETLDAADDIDKALAASQAAAEREMKKGGYYK